ncbi:peptidase U61 LD-carboxypeptidase A [Candidatus Magnetoovum chiemensis]|nr:peptidase U61 LD-carboxypeptidase A [Candidatus Magnetoovum chiemensis]
MLIPQKLWHGDKIGIVSLSDPVKGQEHLDQLENGIRFLRDLGFTVEKGQYISSFETDKKVLDLHYFFSVPSVRAVISTQGGNSAELALPYIDWELIGNNPKIFMGLSDITVFLNAIHFKTGLITFHGNDVRYSLGSSPSEYDKNELIERLMRGKTGYIPSSGERRKTIRSGKASGRLLGGNLRCLLKLVGTGCWPDFTEAILFLEALNIDKERCLMYFTELEALNVFNVINGVIIGHVYSMQKDHPQEAQMEDILLNFTRNHTFPILKVNDFGHKCPNTVLPLGVNAEIDADEKTIKILDKFVR